MYKKAFLIFLAIIFMFPISVYATDVSAESAVVIDANSNDILFSKNAKKEMPMASTTKIMTAYIACKYCNMNDIIEVNQNMLAGVDGTCLGLKKGDKISVYDTVVGMMLTSGNDAANTIACNYSGNLPNFSKLMNEEAKKIGMNNTSFVTPSGLDESGHHSTAYDMALLTSCALQDKMFSEICKMKSATITINSEKTTVYNHNKLLSIMDDCIGVKTGFTQKSGRCLVSAVNRNNQKMICVTLNDGDDWNDHINLYKNCIKKYKQVKVCKSFDAEIVGCGKNKFLAGYETRVSVLNEKNVKCCEYYYKIIYAPIKKGDVIGFANIYYNDKIIKKVNIVSYEDVN